MRGMLRNAAFRPAIKSLLHKLPVKRSVALCLVSLFLAAFLLPSSAQQPWLITPGKGWGPLIVGMEEQDALKILGPPASRNDIARVIHSVLYPDALLTFGQRSDGRYTLLNITITGGNSVTREGIHVGSPLADVLRAYGDTLDNASASGSSVQWCLVLNLSGDRIPQRQTDYGMQYLDLFYAARGIHVEFSPLVRATVWHITVIEPRPDWCVKKVG